MNYAQAGPPGSKDRSECFSQVAFPAFATNETVIFERKSEVSECGAESVVAAMPSGRGRGRTMTLHLTGPA